MVPAGCAPANLSSVRPVTEQPVFSTDELTQIVRSIVAEWKVDAGPWDAFADGNPSKALNVFTLNAHTHSLAEGVLALRDAGCYIQTVPLIRQAIECAMTAAWLVLYDHAVLSLTYEGARQRREVFTKLVAQGVPEAADRRADAVKVLDELESEGGGAGRSFEQRCMEIEGGAAMYVTYRVASQYSHGGTSIADIYGVRVPRSATNTAGFEVTPRPLFDAADDWFGILATMLVTAGLAWDSLEHHHRHRRSLRTAARRLSIPIHPMMSGAGFKADQTAKRRRKAEQQAARAAGPGLGRGPSATGPDSPRQTTR